VSGKPSGHTPFLVVAAIAMGLDAYMIVTAPLLAICALKEKRWPLYALLWIYVAVVTAMGGDTVALFVVLTTQEVPLEPRLSPFLSISSVMHFLIFVFCAFVLVHHYKYSVREAHKWAQRANRNEAQNANDASARDIPSIV
jgi:hypothetical protein